MGALKDSLQALHQRYDTCVLGENGIGISSFIYYYVYDKVMEYSESKVEEFYTKGYWEGGGYKEITILGSSGSFDSYLSTTKQKLQNTNTMIFAYSVANRHSFEVLEDIVERAMSLRDDSPPFAIVGLQADSINERQVTYDEGKSLVEKLGALHFEECSGKEGFGVAEAFESIVRCAFELRELRKGDECPSSANTCNMVSNSNGLNEAQTDIPRDESSRCDPKINEAADEGTNKPTEDDKVSNKKDSFEERAFDANSSQLSRRLRRNNYSSRNGEKSQPCEKSGCCIIM